jgi:hypothetical protein
MPSITSSIMRRDYYTTLNCEHRRILKVGVAGIFAFLAGGTLSYVALFVYLSNGPYRGWIVPLLWISVTGIAMRAGIMAINRRLNRLLPTPGGTQDSATVPTNPN